jgi:hypothetical protein
MTIQYNIFLIHARVAQWIEHWVSNPCVEGSNPSAGIPS